MNFRQKIADFSQHNTISGAYQNKILIIFRCLR